MRRQPLPALKRLGLNEAGRIEARNPAAERLFGYKTDEMIGQPLAMCISSRAHDAQPEDLMHAIRTGEKQLFGSGGEVIGKHQDGTTFPIELTVGDMHLNGQRLFTVIVRDLTERRQIEEKMRHTDRLALVGQLASGLAHEIGTPLNIITGDAELLLMECPNMGSHRDELETIVAQSDRISRLIEQLLTCARKNPHQVMNPLSIEQPVSQALRLLQARFRQADITTLVDIPADLPLVHGVADQLEQVFLNVLVNAWQAMSHRGLLEVMRSSSACVSLRRTTFVKP